MPYFEPERRWTIRVAIGTALAVSCSSFAWATWRLGQFPWDLLLIAALVSGIATGTSFILAYRFRATSARQVGDLIDASRHLLHHGLEERLREGEDPLLNELVQATNALLEQVNLDVQAARRGVELGRAILEATPNGVLLTEADGRIRFLNQAFRELVDVRGEPIGKQSIEVCPVVEIQQAVETVLRGGMGEEIGCTSGVNDIVVRPVQLQDGGAMVVIYDVSRFKRAERARTEFVANVSHELRTPIATIMGYAETVLMDQERLDAEVAKMIEVIFRNAKRLRDMFEDLLELSRIEARRRELPLMRLPVAPVVARAVASACDLCQQRNQTLEVHVDAEWLAWINPEALTTILRNLSMNATNYTPEGGQIQIDGYMENHELVLAVSDTGIGIDRVYHQRIFERFYRVDEGRSRTIGGTGLGLAIVKHLALASGCRVSLNSALGKGSTFKVHLPLSLSGRL